MTEVITNIVDDKQDIKNQLGGTPDVIKVPFRFTETLRPKHAVVKQTVKNISGSMIWGHDVNGVWDTAEWGGTSGGGFILNSATYGVLGTNSLGSGNTIETLYSVVPNNNTFVEWFAQDMFINTTNSTGTLNTTAESYTLTTGQILESEVIAKLRSPITNVKILSHADFDDAGFGMVFPFTLGVSTFGSDNASIEFSNDGGTTWVSGNEDELYTFSSSVDTDELKYRITANSALTLDEPIYVVINT